MQNYDPYGESPYQRALSRPLTAPSFNPNTSASRPPDAIVGSQPATTPVTGRAPAQGVAGPAAGAPVAPTTAVPGQTPEADLAKWGYTGAIPINNVEQQAIDFVNNMYGTGGALGTLNNAQDYYNQVLQGKFGPEGKAYLEQVLNPMRASSMQNYNDMSKALATKFSDIGGYYGGRSGVAQGRLASQSANDMALNEANLRYQGFADNMNRMGGAASGLVGLGQAQSGMSGDMLNYLLSTGNMITGRDTLNRSQYQQALQNSYNDWIRARNESLMPFTWGQNLLGQEATTPIVQTQPSVWGDLLGAAAKVGSAFVKP
jgi:hypothetical protein